MAAVVLAAVDLHHEAHDRKVAMAAAQLAAAESGALHLAYVVPEPPEGYVQAYIPREMAAEVAAEAQRDLDVLARDIGDVATVSATHVLHGPIYLALLDLAKRLPAEVLVFDLRGNTAD